MSQLTENNSTNILIIDDHPQNLQTLTFMLRDSGYQVRQAITAELALNSIKKKLPDLILLDIVLPDMDGYELCRRLKSDSQTGDIPVLFISMLENIEDKVKAFEAGGVDYLIKPFHEKEVLARVKTHLSLKHSQEQLKVALMEKDILIKEVYHRTKNNMAMIISLIRFQANRTEDKSLLPMFDDLQSRIQSMMLVQQQLYQSKDFIHSDLKTYILDLSSRIFHNLNLGSQKISLTYEMESMIVTPEITIPCGLILNELLTNALKHSFQGDNTGEIKIGLKQREKSDILLSVKDNGIGIPAELDVYSGETLGLRLVNGLVKQLNGSMVIKREHGTEFCIQFPKN